MMDCVNIPIGAASGFYDSDNYYKYTFLAAVHNNWYTYDKRRWLSFINQSNLSLNRIGLELKCHEVQDADDFVSIIQENIKKKIPVLLFVKYSAEYYHDYYKDPSFESKHVLIVDKWNEETGIYTMRDSAYLRETKLWKVDGECLFPVCYLEEQVKYLWTNSYCEDDLNTQFIYTIEQVSSEKCSYVDILEYLANGDLKKSKFSDYILDSSDRSDELWNYDRKDFIGNMKGIYKILRYWEEKERIELESWKALMQYEMQFSRERDLIFNKLLKYHKKNKEMPQDILQQLVQRNEENDKKFFELIRCFCNEYRNKKIEEEIFPVAIEPFFNNEAIAFNLETNSSADISNTGVFFYFPSMTKPDNTRVGIVEKTADGQFDNISCNGEEIVYEKGTYKELVLLACAEYGNFTEKVRFFNEEEQIFDTTVSFSDFFVNPSFNEERCYSGEAYFRESKDESRKLEFTSKIFKYDIRLPEMESNKIVLPVQRNIHIFAMYFVR